MAEKDTVAVPQPPSGLPKSVEEKWKQAFVLGFKDAQASDPESPASWGQPAVREANKVLRVPAPQSFDEAMNLAAWMVLHREQKKTKDGVVLNVVTRHGKKFSFPVPAKAVIEQKPETGTQQKDGAGDGGDKGKK